jgi:hypothetical protein
MAACSMTELTQCSHPQHHPLHHSRRRAHAPTPPSPEPQPANCPPNQWKILIVDEDSKKLIDNVVKEDDILNLNITSTLRLLSLC